MVGQSAEVINGIQPMDPIGAVEMRIGFIVINAQNTWANFVKAYYLSYVIRPRREQGGRLSFSYPLTWFQTLGIAIQHWRPRAAPNVAGVWDRRDEPPWHDPNTLLTLCRLLDASNLGNVEAGLSGQSRVFVDLPVFRNYYAHRNEETRKAAVAVATRNGVPANMRPSVILRTVPAGRGQVLLAEWLDDLMLTIEYLCA